MSILPKESVLQAKALLAALNKQERELEDLMDEALARYQTVKKNYDLLISTKSSLASILGVSDDGTDEIAASLMDRNDERQRRSSWSDIMDAVFPILKGKSEGLHYLQLYEELKSRGFVIPGERPDLNLSTYLSRSDKLERVERGVYKLVGKSVR